MKDVFGNTLEIGDVVALTPHGVKNLTVGTVVGFTPTRVRVQYMRTLTWRHDPELDQVLRAPEDLVKRMDSPI